MREEHQPLRTVERQMLLLPRSPREVCSEIGLNWWAALKLHEDGWLSFNPEATQALDAAEEAELVFVGSLASAGCDRGLLTQLLSSLEKPYRYRVSEIYYDWLSRRWRSVPTVEEVNPQAVFDDWLEELQEAADADTLTGLAEQISAALDAVKQNEKGG